MKTWKILTHPLVLFPVAAIVAFFRCLAGGQAYFANDLLAQFGPWRAFLRDRLLAGDFPLWNPHMMCGQPCFADLQMLMLYPLNYLTILLPTATGLTVFFALHMALAGWGMQRWLTSLRVGAFPAAVGGVLFAWSGFYWQELIHPPVHAAFAWLPWLFDSLERLSREATPKRALLAGLVWSQLFLAGSFQVSLGGLYGGLLYFLFRLWKRAKPEVSAKGVPSFLRSRLKAGAVAALLFALGSLPLFFQFVPTSEFSKLSVRRTPDLTYDNFNAQFSMRPGTVGLALFPAYTLPKDQNLESAIQTPKEGGFADNDYYPIFAHLGVWAPLLLFFAFRRRDGLPVLLGSLALAAVLVAFGRFFPLHRAVCALVPGFDLIRVPFRFIYGYTLCAIPLAAMGLDVLLRSTDERERRFLRLAAWSYAGVMILAALTRPENTGRELLALVLGAAGLAGVFTPRFAAAARALLATAILLPVLLTGWAFFGVGSDRNMDFADRTAPGFMQTVRETRPFRLYVSGQIPYAVRVAGKEYAQGMPDNLCVPLGYKTLAGYDPLNLKSMSDLRNTAPPSLMYLTATKSIVTMRDQGDVPGFKKRRNGELHVYDLDPPPSYVSAPYDLRVIPDASSRLAALRSPDFKPYLTAILDRPLPPQLAGGTVSKDVRLVYQVTAEEPDRQVFDVEVTEPCLAVFSEAAFPGWKARVDGRESEIFTVNHAFRGVFIPEGRHGVEFTFTPSWWGWIVPGLLLWLVAFTLAFFLASRRPKTASA